MLPKLFVLISHELTPFQREDAVASLGVSQIVLLGGKEWSQIPAEDEDITVFLAPLKQQLHMLGEAGDFLLVQGDFGATYNMVEYAKHIGKKPILRSNVITDRPDYKGIETGHNVETTSL